MKTDLDNKLFESCSVIIEPKKSITIQGVYTNHANGPQHFKKTFKIGDWAEYGSYNLKYNGRITNIGKKTVTIQHYDNRPDKTRLTLNRFAFRNWDFDLEESKKYNSEVMHYI